MLRKIVKLFLGKSNNSRNTEHKDHIRKSNEMPESEDTISIEIPVRVAENLDGGAENLNAGAENLNGGAEHSNAGAEIPAENLPTNYAAIQVQDTENLNGEGTTINTNPDSETKLSESPHATFFTVNDLTPAEIDDLLFIHQSEYNYFIQVLLTQPEVIAEFLDNEINNDSINNRDIPKGHLFGKRFVEYINDPKLKEYNKEYLSLVSAYAKLIAKVGAYERISAMVNAKASESAYYANIKDNPNLYVAQQALLEFFKNHPGLKNILVSNRRLLIETAFLFVHNYNQRSSNIDDSYNNNNNNFNSPRG